jgi:hypothetical protein
MTLNTNAFHYIEYKLSKFKTLKFFCIECQLYLKEDRFIYVIVSNLGSSYYVFVSTFYAIREALESAHKERSLESFCDALIREQYKLV